jgi:NADH-quinone oxidoreductase subunit L
VTSLLWWLVAVPAAAGAVLVLLGRQADRWGPATGVATSGAALALAVAAGRSASVSAPFLLGEPFALRLDGLSLALAVTVCAVTAAVLAAAPAQVADRRGRLSGWLLLFLAAVLLTLAAETLLPLLVGWELMGAASYVLIAHDLRDRRAAGSATTALLTTRALDLGLYAAAGAALAGGASLGLDGLPALQGPWLHLAALGVLTASLGKAAQLPVSFWLSRAMDGPSPVSALLHSAAMVAMGGYLLLRTAPLLTASGWADDAAAWVGATTAVVLGVVAIAQHDLKQLLAASTASQLGFVVLAAGLAEPGAGAAHLVGHAAVKSLLFLAAGLWLHDLGTRELSRLRGALCRAPAVGAVAVVGLLSLAGLPPLALWGTKDLVLDAAREHSPPLYAAAVLAAALSAAYAGRVLALVLRPTDDARPSGQPSRGWLPLVPLAVGAAILAAIAVGPGARAFGELVAGEPLSASVGGLLLSAALAVGYVAFTWRYGERLAVSMPRWAADWLHLHSAVDLAVVRPVLVLSRALAAFDDHVLDRAVMGSAGVVRTVASSLSRADDRLLDGAVEAASSATSRLAALSARADVRGVDGAVTAVATATQRLGSAARRPQTGQLHQYYGQAAAVLVAATVLLLVMR